jgi:hypothetical protein
VSTFDPIGFGGNGVSAVAAEFRAGFATTTVCNPDVVTNGATFGATGNRDLSLHLFIIRLGGWERLHFHFLHGIAPGVLVLCKIEQVAEFECGSHGGTKLRVKLLS